MLKLIGWVVGVIGLVFLVFTLAFFFKAVTDVFVPSHSQPKTLEQMTDQELLEVYREACQREPQAPACHVELPGKFNTSRRVYQ